MDFRRFCEDYGIPTAPHGHSHHRRGWINVECPFCTGNPGYHLGYEIRKNKNYFNCYRCGHHNALQVISSLANCNTSEAKDLIEQYGGVKVSAPVIKDKNWVLGKDIKLPTPMSEVGKLGKSYLLDRGFEPDFIIRKYGLVQTGPVGLYKHRIVIPIYYAGHIVSYTCRSYVPTCNLRYRSCAEANELVPHKDILYNLDNCRRGGNVVLVEGCTDVWRLGDGAVASFGTSVTKSQLHILTNFKQVILLSDNDHAGITAWQKVADQLRQRQVKVRLMYLSKAGDPSELSNEDALYFMRSLGLSGNK